MWYSVKNSLFMQKRTYWILIIVLILLIIAIAACLFWFINKENIFNEEDGELIISNNANEDVVGPGGNNYIYWLQEIGTEKNLMAMRGDGREAGNVFEDDAPWPNTGIVEIASDGSRYAYLCPDNKNKICVYNLNDKKLLKLEIKNEIQDLSWSNDGKNIIFISKDNYNGKENNIIAIIDADGNNYREIISGNNLLGQPAMPLISPNGEKILFQISKENGNQGIYIINIDGQEINPLIDSEKNETDARFSPDGNRVVYCVKNGTEQIYIMNIDRSNNQRLTQLGNNHKPDFSPDGDRMVFVSDRDHGGVWEIYAMDIDGANQTRLTNNDINDLWPRWSSDKINIQVEDEINDPGIVLNSFIMAKISDTAEVILELVHPDSRSNMDLINPYRNLYSEDVVSYNLLAEQDMEGGKKEFEVVLKYRNDKLAEQTLYYQLELYNNNWVVSDVKYKEESIEDENNILSKNIIVGPIENDRTALENKQVAVDDGNEVWLLDPYEVAKRDSNHYGFDPNKDIYTLVSKVEIGDYSGTGEATIEVNHENDIYIIQLIQPTRPGDDGIWALNNIVKK